MKSISSMVGVARGGRGLAAAIVVAAALGGGARPAYAVCAPCLMDGVISAADGLAKGATLAQMAASQASTLAGIAESAYKMMTGQSGVTASVVAGREKELAADKELTQAHLNYQAASAQQKRFTEAQDLYLAPSAQPYRTCETMANANTTQRAGESARTLGKVLNEVAGQNLMRTENAALRAKKVLDNYRANYCSDDDEARGRCKAVDKKMQNAAVSVESLMNPTAGDTYNDQEAKAALDYVNMVTSPTPPEMLPKALEGKSEAAERFAVAQMSAEAQMSMANHSLVQILASKMPRGKGPEDATSLVGLIKSGIMERFGNPRFAAELAAKDSTGILKDVNRLMAMRNFLAYHSYLQNERVESLLATQLAIAVKDNSEIEIAAARAAAGNGR